MSRKYVAMSVHPICNKTRGYVWPDKDLAVISQYYISENYVILYVNPIQ